MGAVHARAAEVRQEDGDEGEEPSGGNPGQRWGPMQSLEPRTHWDMEVRKRKASLSNNKPSLNKALCCGCRGVSCSGYFVPAAPVRPHRCGTSPANDIPMLTRGGSSEGSQGKCKKGPNSHQQPRRRSYLIANGTWVNRYTSMKAAVTCHYGEGRWGLRRHLRRVQGLHRSHGCWQVRHLGPADEVPLDQG